MLLAGCDGVHTSDTGPDDPLEVLQRTLVVDHGLARLEIEVGQHVGAFMVVGSSGDYLAVSSVYDPAGDVVLDWYDWYYQPNLLTMAFWYLEGTTVLNWPIRAQDAPLTGGTWAVDLEVLEADGSYPMTGAIDVTVLLKEDADFSSGKLQARVVYASGMDSDPAVVQAVEAAVARWTEIYAAYGLRLVVRYDSSDLDPRMPSPSAGDSEIEAIAADTPEGWITMLLGQTVGGSFAILGESGNIPGALVPSPYSAVAIALNNHWGIDGVFSEAETRMMGNTMAHEVGHYLGLFHPVESTYDYWDALDDTMECSNENSCIDALGYNMMFFTAICGVSTCWDQDEITADQVGVMHRCVALR